MATGGEGGRRMAAGLDQRTTAAVGMATVAMSVLLVAPRAAPAMLALVLATLLLWQPLAAVWSGRAPLPAVFATGAGLGAYLLLNALWSFDVGQGLGKAALFLILNLGLWLGWRSLPAVPAQALERVARALMIAFAVALAYLLFEELSNHLVKRTLFSLMPAIRPDAKHLQTDGEIVSHIALYVSNRNMAAVSFVLWPLMLGCVTLLGRPRGLVAAVLLWLAAALAITRSQHDSSAVALFAAPLVFALARLRPRAALWLLAAGWIAAVLLVVPFVSQAYKAGFYTDKRLPMSARHRVILWGYTAEQIPKHFWRGVGVDSTKPLDAAAKAEGRQVQPADHSYPRRTGTHAHNLFLQTWYELGAIGAALVLAFGLAVLAAIRRLEERTLPYAIAAFATTAILAAFSWGMWQPWYMAGFATSAMLMLLMAELARRVRPAP